MDSVRKNIISFEEGSREKSKIRTNLLGLISVMENQLRAEKKSKTSQITHLSQESLSKSKYYITVGLVAVAIGSGFFYNIGDRKTEPENNIARQKVTPDKNDSLPISQKKVADMREKPIDSPQEPSSPLRFYMFLGAVIVGLGATWFYNDKSSNVEPVKFSNYEKYRFNEKKTEKVIAPLKYSWADSFSEGLARVKLNGKWGYIDQQNNQVITLKYDWANSFSEGLSNVKLNRKCGFIDKQGNVITPFKYDLASSFSEGLARVKLNGKYGFINKQGKEVIPLKYDDASHFSEGRAYVKLNGELFYINPNGERITN